jgi:cytosine/adenosine deaminase-related metal-dependent hydrolase
MISSPVSHETATRNPTIYLGLSDTLGTVEEGKKADLVLLEANPLANISNTKRITAVIVNGRLIQKVSLDKMLKDAEASSNKEALYDREFHLDKRF